MDGVDVDATVTIEARNDCRLGSFDDEGSNAPRFQPTIRCGSNSSISFLVAFTDAATGLPVALRSFFVTGIDLDGASGYREFHELRGFSEYTLDGGTLLTVDARGDGYNQFLGRGDSLGGISFDDTASYIARYEASVSQIRFRLGTSGNTGSTNRQFSLALGAAGGTFSDPEVSSAPLPVLSTASALVTAPFQVTATFNEPVQGLSENEISVDNGAVDSGSLSSDVPGLAWTFDVVPSGDGAVLVQVPESVATSVATGLANANSNVLRVTVDATAPQRARGWGERSGGCQLSARGDPGRAVSWGGPRADRVGCRDGLCSRGRQSRLPTVRFDRGALDASG